MASFMEVLEEQLQDLEGKNASFKAILYGTSGVGKTVASLQIAQYLTDPEKIILYIDSGEGWVSTQNHPSLQKRVKRWTDVRVPVLEKIAEGIENKQGSLAKVGCVIFDEHSSITDEDLMKITRKRAEVDKTKDPDDPKWPDMSTAKNRTVSYTNKFIKLENVHIILIAHERKDEDNLKRQVFGPSYMPATSKALREKVHLVGRLTADEVNTEEGATEYIREVQVWPTKQAQAKTRIGGFNSIRVSVKDLVVAVKEWLSGTRESLEQQEIKPDPEEENVHVAEATDELQEEVVSS